MIQYDHCSYACQSNELLNGKQFNPSREAIPLYQNEAFHKGEASRLGCSNTFMFIFTLSNSTFRDKINEIMKKYNVDANLDASDNVLIQSNEPSSEILTS